MTGTAVHDGWRSVDLVLAVTDAVPSPGVRALATAWFAVPVVAALAVVVAVVVPPSRARLLLRSCGLLAVAVCAAVVSGFHRAGWELSWAGPALVVAAAAALVLLGPSPVTPRSTT